MTPQEHLEQVLNAAPHERSAAIHLATSSWRSFGVPDGIHDLLRELVSHSLAGATRDDVRLVGALLPDAEVEMFMRTLTSRTPAVDALLQDRDPHHFLNLIADIRDRVVSPMGWWPTDQCALLSALHLAEASVPEPFPAPTAAQWCYLFIGASPNPRRLVSTRTMFRRSSDAGAQFVEFAFSNPHLLEEDRATLLGLMHPQSVLRVRHLLTSDQFSNWISQRALLGSDHDILDCLVTELGPLLINVSDRALRVSLASSLPSVKKLGLQRLADLVGPSGAPVAEAILRESGVSVCDLPGLVAACRRNP